MRSLSKKIYFNLLFFLIINQFVNCELYNSTIATQFDKVKKVTLKNHHSVGVGSWKPLLYKLALYNTVMLVTFVASNIVSEWSEGRKLTFIERELAMINLNLAWIVTFIICGDSIFRSREDENLENESNQKVQAESAEVL